MPKKGQRKDITGQRFGSLTALRIVPTPDSGAVNQFVWWEYRCDCGKIKSLASSNVQSGATKSCGCLTRDLRAEKSRKPPGESGRNALFSHYRTGAKRRGLDFFLSVEQFTVLTSKNCFYCGDPPFTARKIGGRCMTGAGTINSTYLFNGIDRVNNDLGYLLDNCVPCCKFCNYGKSNKTQDEFLRWIARVYTFNFKSKV